ncbi:C-C motif chemokine 3-like [Clinocottus analis]|uniref:C-C motif chemokine 3-like n=1 Tax=Clinocottus analis TaxID=304258 RepID=UPI0035C181DE
MASTGHAKLFFCILFITCCCTASAAQTQKVCCFSVRNQRVPRRTIADYERQISGHGCSIDAIILLTSHGRKICVPADEPWVQNVMKYVDALKE